MKDIYDPAKKKTVWVIIVCFSFFIFYDGPSNPGLFTQLGSDVSSTSTTNLTLFAFENAA
jgi:hypothetical protein